MSWKYLNYNGLRENEKFSNENQYFDWIKLVNNGLLADIDLFDSMILRV